MIDEEDKRRTKVSDKPDRTGRSDRSNREPSANLVRYTGKNRYLKTRSIRAQSFSVFHSLSFSRALCPQERYSSPPSNHPSVVVRRLLVTGVIGPPPTLPHTLFQVPTKGGLNTTCVKVMFKQEKEFKDKGQWEALAISNDMKGESVLLI
ncbi:hypothetical protein PIB30_026060 [Stylosanthes scabra]|uniref:Uncharacterized protein n=1 Tax=Stylosanthes scabra TaxID=79078 RepID=A0ABU6QAN0_9FABA|nr:hypothetical protein [Stylosanthes scabra]